MFSCCRSGSRSLSEAIQVAICLDERIIHRRQAQRSAEVGRHTGATQVLNKPNDLNRCGSGKGNADYFTLSNRRTSFENSEGTVNEPVPDGK